MLSARRITVILSALLIATLSISTSITSQADQKDFAALDAFVEAQMRKNRIPGLALGIVHNDEVAYVKGYGQADPSGRPVDPETPFILASVSKSFTAMAVMQLVDAGLVQLDAPVQTYIPWFTVADEGAAAQITVRQLLYQTSGLPTIAGRQQPDPDQSLEASVRALADVSLTTAPGERFQYSNANYNTLGLIVEQVTGQSFGQYVEAQIYAPLEMTHSHVSRAEAEIDGLAAGHRTWFTFPVQETLPYVAADLPSGFLIASAEDMAHYLVAQLNGGQYNGMQVLSAESVAQMHTPPTGLAEPSAYAMGWAEDIVAGEEIVGHSGSLPNYLTQMLLLPDEGWGIVLLANAGSVTMRDVLLDTTGGVIDFVMGRPLPDPSFNVANLIPVAILALGLGAGYSLIRTPTRWRARLEAADRPIRTALLPLLFNAALPVLLLVGVPAAMQTSLAVFHLIMPDIGTLLIAISIISGLQGILRFIILVRTLKPE